MNRSIARIPAVIGLVLTLVAATPELVAQNLSGCQEFAFSTEEDFVTQGPVPPDGNPVISDGDLLGLSFTPTTHTTLCARNSFFMQPFDVTVDLGLDAVDIISLDPTYIAFSTELNSSTQGQFSAGDLLITSGVAIPHNRLTYSFLATSDGPDLGLDAVHFVGTVPNIIEFINNITVNMPQPEAFSSMLAEHQMDIWFSTEQNARPVHAPLFLDGDLLSARFGTIVAANSTLLPAEVPAGIPTRGADYGLDAASSSRDGKETAILFSTEIVHLTGFTDGDVLLSGIPGIQITNEEMILTLEVRADFVGLDALYSSAPEPGR